MIPLALNELTSTHQSLPQRTDVELRRLSCTCTEEFQGLKGVLK